MPKPLQPPYDATVVAASSPVDRAWLRRGIDVLEAAGFRFRYDEKTVGATGRFSAGDPAARWKALTAAIRAHDVVFFARGGHGMFHLMPHMLQTPASSLPRRWLIGGSDATVAAAWCQKSRRKFVYGPMPSAYLSREPTARSVDTLVSILSGGPSSVQAPLVKVLRRGQAEAQLVGGCLSIVAALASTKLRINTSGKLLLLEDVGEHPFRIDRMLWQLRMSGAFDRVAGVVLGTFPDCNVPNGATYTIQDVFAEFFSTCKFPVLYGWPAGHVTNGADLDSLVLGDTYVVRAQGSAPALLRQV